MNRVTRMDRRVLAVCGLLASASARAHIPARPDAELEKCTRNLQTIGRALAAYQRDRGDLPPHLSDLYPKYLTERQVLRCPADMSPSSAGAGDPQEFPSYFYGMSTDRIPDPGYALPQLGPHAFGLDATWREVRMAQRVNFGDRVPIVSCHHHAGNVLHLAPSGYVYQHRSGSGWDTQPATIAVMLQRLEHSLSQGPAALSSDWDLRRVEDYCLNWIGSPLLPAFRCRLGIAAKRLGTATPDLPVTTRSDAYRLAARLYRAAGQTNKAIGVCQESLRSPGSHAGAVFLLADMRYQASGRRGEPPVNAYLRAELERLEIPGFSVGVFRDGKVVLAKGYGVEDRGSATAATQDTVYPILSATKMFTGMATMMLVQERRLSLDDRAEKLLPDLPPAWSEVTVRHLLSHTSGIPNLLSLPEWYKIESGDEAIRRAAALPMEFRPGEKWSYNQTGYILLKRIIEKVSGKSYPEYLAERVFRPLQMTATRFGSSSAPGAFVQAANGLSTSISDLAKWDAALYTEDPLKQSSLEQMWTPTRLSDGKVAYYGYGWALGMYHGHRYAGHGGGMQNWIVRYPDNRLTVVVLARTFGANTQPLTDRLADYYLGLQKSKTDREPEITARMREVLLGLIKGRATPHQFTAHAYATLTADLTQTATFYRNLGPLRSFRFIERTDDEQRRTYRYRATFGDTPWIQRFVVTADGKIAELGVEPE